MSNRNRKRKTKRNDDQMYRKHFESRGIENIPNQYTTGKFYYPTDEEIANTVVLEEVWKLGDRLYRYAKKYYNSEEYWWLIAWFNQKPTEHHFKVGDSVKIISNLSEALALYYGN